MLRSAGLFIAAQRRKDRGERPISLRANRPFLFIGGLLLGGYATNRGEPKPDEVPDGIALVDVRAVALPKTSEVFGEPLPIAVVEPNVDVARKGAHSPPYLSPFDMLSMVAHQESLDKSGSTIHRLGQR